MFYSADLCYANCCRDNNNLDADTLRVIYYLDGKQVPYSIIRDKGEKGELGNGIGANESKKAIQLYGEKFRYGVVFVNSKEEEENTFQINGKIDARYNGNQIMLFTFNQDTINSVDTTVIKNGEFFFRGKEYLADFSMVSTGNYPDRVLSSEVILNKGIIYMEIDSMNKVWGGELNDKLIVFQDSLRILNEQRTCLLNDSLQNENLKIIGDHIMTFVFDFITENQNNLLGINTFEKYIGIFSFADNTKFDDLCDIFDKERKNDNVKRYLELRQKYNQRLQSVGKKYKDCEFQTPADNSKKLSDYIGKSDYIYIDFWASWCGPCIAEMPLLKEIYKKYKIKGFEIIGISLDTDKKSWINALNKIKVLWVQLCNFEGLQSKLAEDYYIKEIPYGILLDKEGIIIETNIRGSALDKKLYDLFNQK